MKKNQKRVLHFFFSFFGDNYAKKCYSCCKRKNYCNYREYDCEEFGHNISPSVCNLDILYNFFAILSSINLNLFDVLQQNQ